MSSGLRILMITTSHHWNDTRIYELEALGLRREGITVSILSMLDSEIGPELCDVDVVVGKGSKSRLGRFLRNSLNAYLYAYSHRRDFDVFHFHDPEFLPYGALLSWTSGKPVVYDMHEFLSEVISSRSWVPKTLRRSLSMFAGAVEHLCVRRIGNVVAMNEMGAERGRVLGAKRATAFMAVPDRAFAAGFDPFDPSRRGVVYVGGVSAVRGADIVQDLAPLLYRKHNVCTLVAGPLHDGKAKELPGTNGVRYMGVLNRVGIKRLLGSASIGWIPLKHTPNHDKGWAIKLGEYMGAGLPVVASDLDYCGEIVRRCKCGIVVAAEDRNAHLEALEYLIDNPDAAREMGENGRQVVLNDFNRETFAAGLARFYRELPGGRNRVV